MLAFEQGFQVFEHKFGLLFPFGAEADDQGVELEEEGVPRRIDMGFTQALDDFDSVLMPQDKRFSPATEVRGLHYGFRHVLPCTGNDS